MLKPSTYFCPIRGLFLTGRQYSLTFKGGAGQILALPLLKDMALGK